MQKTLRVQPYIKGLFIFAGFTGWFILFIHFFGLPPFLRIAIGQVRNFLFRMVALIKVQLFRIYRLVSAVLPVRSKKPTGWDVVKATWSRFWLQFLDHLTSFHRWHLDDWQIHQWIISLAWECKAWADAETIYLFCWMYYRPRQMYISCSNLCRNQRERSGLGQEENPS